MDMLTARGTASAPPLPPNNSIDEGGSTSRVRLGRRQAFGGPVRADELIMRRRRVQPVVDASLVMRWTGSETNSAATAISNGIGTSSDRIGAYDPATS